MWIYYGERSSSICYKVVRQGAPNVAPQPLAEGVSKQFYTSRVAELQSGGDSILMYEEWRESGEQRLLDEIRDYNEEDCASTARPLRERLLDLRAEAERAHGSIPWFQGKQPEEPEGVRRRNG